MVNDMYRTWKERLVPAMEENSIFFLRCDELTPEEKQYYTNYYQKSVPPVLTSLPVDPVPPIPKLLNKSLNAGVEVEGETITTTKGVVQVPHIVPSLLK